VTTSPGRGLSKGITQKGRPVNRRKTPRLASTITRYTRSPESRSTSSAAPPGSKSPKATTGGDSRIERPKTTPWSRVGSMPIRLRNCSATSERIPSAVPASPLLAPSETIIRSRYDPTGFPEAAKTACDPFGSHRSASTYSSRPDGASSPDSCLLFVSCSDSAFFDAAQAPHAMAEARTIPNNTIRRRMVVVLLEDSTSGAGRVRYDGAGGVSKEFGERRGVFVVGKP